VVQNAILALRHVGLATKVSGADQIYARTEPRIIVNDDLIGDIKALKDPDQRMIVSDQVVNFAADRSIVDE
jgi:hypothetical protein